MRANSLEMEEKSCFQFKANFLPCTILQIIRYDWEVFEQQLKKAVSQAPYFFMDLPIIIDLDKIKALGVLNFAKLKEILLAYKMRPIAVRGGSAEQHSAAAENGFPLLTASSKQSRVGEKDKEKLLHLTKLVTTPVRSGMQVYARESDLIVTAAVSQGAELFADGNIHVYGSLRGRVLAGMQGNTQARIFCRISAAELISIAGYYLTKEEIQCSVAEDGVKQIYLENEQLHIEAV
jgi:septum site-determining protein MinC